MTEQVCSMPETYVRDGVAVQGWAFLMGVLLGVAAKLLGLLGEPATMLGQGVAFWITAGFLVARQAARGKELLDGTVWASSTIAVYLGTWLLAYSAVYGLQDPGGFGAAWLNERIFFVLLPAASVVLGLVAAGSWRGDRLGDAALAAPLAWALPEAGLALGLGWRYAVVVGVPSVLIGVVPLLATRARPVDRRVYAIACATGGAIAFLALRLVMNRW